MSSKGRFKKYSIVSLNPFKYSFFKFLSRDRDLSSKGSFLKKGPNYRTIK